MVSLPMVSQLEEFVHGKYICQERKLCVQILLIFAYFFHVNNKSNNKSLINSFLIKKYKFYTM